MLRQCVFLLLLTTFADARSRTEAEDLRITRLRIKSGGEIVLSLSELFYPSDTLGSHHVISNSLNDRQKSLVRQSLERALLLILTEHEKKFENIQQYMGAQLDRHPIIHLSLETRGIPDLQSEMPTQTIFIDSSVFEALLESAIVSASPNRASDYAIDEFIRRRDELKLFARGSAGVYSEKLHAFIDTGSHKIGGRFQEAVRFALAHEVGHLTMHHLVCSKLPDCKTFDAQELTADRYATYLTVHNWFNGMAALLNGWGADGSKYTPDSIQGVETFFEYAYELAGFRRTGACACSYPDPASRKSQMARVIVDAGGFSVLGSFQKLDDDARKSKTAGKYVRDK